MLNRRHHAEHFLRKLGPQVHGEEEDVDLEVVDFAEEDDDISLSDTPRSDGQEGPALRSARLDFPVVMTQAACRLTAPPTAATLGRVFTARCFQRSRPSSRPRCQTSGSVWRRHGGVH